MTRTLAQRMQEAFGTFADRVAIADDAGTLTYGELARNADALAEALIARGVCAGDRVVVLLPNTRVTVLAYLAIWKIGAIVVPTNPALTAFELTYIFEHSQPSAIIAGAPSLANARAALESSKGSVRGIFCDSSVPDAVSIAELPAASRPHWHTEMTSEVVSIMYTSGTSGRSKGVLVPHVGVEHSVAAWSERVELTTNDVVLAVLPFFHVYSNVLVLQATLLIGAKLVPLAEFRYPDILRVLSEHRITFFPAVPPMMLALAERTWDPGKYDLSSLRLIVSGGAPLPHETWQRVRDKLGVPMYDAYGCTETSPILAVGPVSAPHRHGSCGQPAPGVTIRICDPSGTALPSMEPGEIRALTPGLMKGYYNDPAATAEAIVDGWYRTGDVGYLDADGYLFITDRIKDVIFVAGMNVYPREVEEAIHQFPSVGNAAVVRMQFKATGEAVMAYVVPAPEATIDTVELLAFLRERLAPHKIPKRIEIVDMIPTTASGKIQKYKLDKAPE